MICSFHIQFIIELLDASEEKKVRAALLAASERFITKDTVLILDSLNYIKGFRYQLYCQARAASTPHLVVHCETLEETCRAWNRKKERIYPDDQLEDLFLRFEAPNNQNKWDSPLISIISDGLCDSDLEATFKESILPVISTTPNRPPSTSTLTNKPVSSSSTSHSSNSIQILDQETQKIIDTIIRHQQDNLCLVKFPSTTKTLNLPRPVSQATLSRIRRQFLHMNRLHPTVDPEKIKNLFIDFMAANMYL